MLIRRREFLALGAASPVARSFAIPQAGIAAIPTRRLLPSRQPRDRSCSEPGRAGRSGKTGSFGLRPGPHGRSFELTRRNGSSSQSGRCWETGLTDSDGKGIISGSPTAISEPFISMTPRRRQNHTSLDNFRANASVLATRPLMTSLRRTGAEPDWARSHARPSAETRKNDSVISALFGSQRDHRIDFCRTSRRQVRRTHRDESKQC